jgi:hypothetical protein
MNISALHDTFNRDIHRMVLYSDHRDAESEYYLTSRFGGYFVRLERIAYRLGL